MDVLNLQKGPLASNTTVSFTRRAPLNAHMDESYTYCTGWQPCQIVNDLHPENPENNIGKLSGLEPLRVGLEGQLVSNASFKYLGASDITFMMSLTTHVLTIVLATELRDKKAILWDIIVVKLSTKRPVRDKKARSITRRAFGAPRTQVSFKLPTR